jgi:hypothetical protein
MPARKKMRHARSEHSKRDRQDPKRETRILEKTKPVADEPSFFSIRVLLFKDSYDNAAF